MIWAVIAAVAAGAILGRISVPTRRSQYPYRIKFVCDSCRRAGEAFGRSAKQAEASFEWLSEEHQGHELHAERSW